MGDNGIPCDTFYLHEAEQCITAFRLDYSLAVDAFWYNTSAFVFRTMRSGNSGFKNAKPGDNSSKKAPKTSPSGSEDPGYASTLPSSPERPDVAGQGRSSGPLGAVAPSNPHACCYVTEEGLSSALLG